MEKHEPLKIDYERTINQSLSREYQQAAWRWDEKIRALSSEEVAQVDNDLKSLKHNLGLGKLSIKDVDAYLREYESWALKLEVTSKIADLAEAA